MKIIDNKESEEETSAMDSYKKVYRYFELISIGSSALITKAITDWLQGLKVQQVVVLSLTFALVYLLNEFFVWIFKNVFSNFTYLRRYFFGEEFVEGLWIEFLTDNNNLTSVGIVLIKADKEGNGLNLVGDNYSVNSEGDWLLNYRFSSKNELTKFQFPILDFAYVNRFAIPVNGRTSIEGVAQLTFSSLQGTPSRYHASFNLAEDDPRIVGLEGWKIQDRSDLKEIKKDSISSSNLYKIIEKYIKIKENNQQQN
ncbi:hypothetical protein IQ249_23820 [Lusitaniella coriacea LEGE 07157]|uniref:Uncharacterized protein n=1 Tax=Lusitaniella coriacea LEGE 07157 TaxID=945747 RepID=A0A8J7E1M1_9CYAN|nr:hypothetical protein [Lusitaniella coriacea]MBE9118921.1 hypothetical protein [Lusitaniella coriacea LEGE 07157]